MKLIPQQLKTATTEEWFTNPSYWVIGALFFIILIAVIARGGVKKDHIRIPLNLILQSASIYIEAVFLRNFSKMFQPKASTFFNP